ncbi:helix-turn-helix domain-containing protein [Rhodoferax sp.]|uniref:helix-turn-helix domain-containing protein n=1 Tax=Rhodoferax sp. TaxID=50421 RepID=UPI0025FFFE40|nr:helix-turn-helix domain-containing protein [Rhodoferax sp.]
MSEPVGQDGIALNPVPDTAASAVEAGNLLRKAREATGLHVAALAVSLKVPVNKLEALEAGRIDLLPDLTFARALAASICRTLKIDPAPVLAHFPATGVSRLGAEAPSINTPYRPTESGPRISLRGQMLNPSVLVVAALLVAAVAVVLWPKSSDAPKDVATVLAPGAEATETPVVPVPMADASEPVPVSLPVEPVIAPAAVVAASATQAVVLTAQAESWVKVTDAKGVVGVGRTLKAGDTVEVTGPFPMAVVVGRVDAVQLQVRGQPYDMAAFPKDRVARFEVK